MKNDQPPGLTILGRCDSGPRLIADNVRCWEWQSYPRRITTAPRYRQLPLLPWQGSQVEPTPRT